MLDHQPITYDADEHTLVRPTPPTALPTGISNTTSLTFTRSRQARPSGGGPASAVELTPSVSEAPGHGFNNVGLSLKTIVDALPSPFLVVDVDTRRVRAANKAALREGHGSDFCYRTVQGRDKRCAQSDHLCPVRIVQATGNPVRMAGDRACLTESRQVGRVHGYPIFDANGAIRQVIVSYMDPTECPAEDERVRRLNERLAEERQSLREKNVALRELLQHISEQRQSIAATMQANIDKRIRPALRRLADAVPESARRRLDTVEIALADVLSPFVSQLESANGRLSPREIEIARYIKNGSSTREIADTLNISDHTVLKLRQRIRRKLGLRNRKTNLAMYLRNLS
ncbi:hypothetical protein GF377_09640 [candidate division GN15 bacterium]|nr:hypothetical protein [candidate division GN15 bacterium]